MVTTYTHTHMHTLKVLKIIKKININLSKKRVFGVKKILFERSSLNLGKQTSCFQGG